MPIDQGLSVEIVLITKLRTGTFRNLKPFFDEWNVLLLFVFTLLEDSRVAQCLICTEFILSGRAISVALSSTQLMTQAALCGERFSLPVVWRPPRYYTTASASPATTNIPTTTAVLTTVKSSVLVGDQQS